MAKHIERKCPGCGVISSFRSDQKTCGSTVCKRIRLQTSKELGNEKIEVVGDICNIYLPKTRICTLEQLIEHCKIDTKVWEVERFTANKWEVGMKPAATTEYTITSDDREIPMWVRIEDEPIVIPLFQIKASFKKKVDVVAVQKEIDELKAIAKNNAPLPKLVIHKTPVSGNMLEINFPDIHMGKLSWAVETGYENYDTKISAELFREAFAEILDRAKGYKFESILFIVGNDLLNSDNAEGTTTKGTKVSSDCRFQKTFGVTRDLMIEAIEHLRKIAPVKVITVFGNHDELSVWHLGDSLECYFHKYPDVEIDNSPKQRKYHQFGKVMLMFTHGHKSKRLDLPLIMATEQSEMFGKTKFREVHTGHLHLTKVEEQHGVRVRVLPALTAPDAWLAENGFVGNIRAAEGYIWNKEEGLVGMVFYNKPS